MDELIKIFNNIKEDNNLDFSIFLNKTLLFGNGMGEKSRLDVNNEYFEVSFISLSPKEASIYKYFISKTIEEYFKNNIDNSPFKNLLLNKKIHKNSLEKLKKDMKSGTLIIISSKNTKYNLNLLHEIYGDNALVEYFDDNIVFYKNMKEDIDSEVLSIYSAIVENSLEEPYIAYSHNDISYKDVNCAYNNLNKLINISKIYLKNTYILKEDNFRLLYLLDSLNSKSKIKILNIKENEYILNNLDKDLILTIITLVENDMNLQKASEKLFIHRNTLNYRLQKFKNDFNIDLKNIKNIIYVYILILLKREADIKFY